MDKKQIKQHISANVQSVLSDRLEIVRDPTLRDRVNRAVEAIYAIFESHGIKPDETAMGLTHSAERWMPGETILKWNESDYPGLTFEETIFEDGKPVCGDAKLRPEVVAWLDENCSYYGGWEVDFDRGDFGDGLIITNLKLPSLEMAKHFMSVWGKRE